MSRHSKCTYTWKNLFGQYVSHACTLYTFLFVFSLANSCPLPLIEVSLLWKETHIKDTQVPSVNIGLSMDAKKNIYLSHNNIPKIKLEKMK